MADCALVIAINTACTCLSYFKAGFDGNCNIIVLLYFSFTILHIAGEWIRLKMEGYDLVMSFTLVITVWQVQNKVDASALRYLSALLNEVPLCSLTRIGAELLN